MEDLRGKKVVRVAAGGSHSAAVTESGQLFTWGKGSYGRLGHGEYGEPYGVSICISLSVAWQPNLKDPYLVAQVVKVIRRYM